MAAPAKKREIRQKLHDDEDRVSSSSEDEEYEVADEQVRDNCLYRATYHHISELTSFSNTRSLFARNVFHRLLVFELNFPDFCIYENDKSR